MTQLTLQKGPLYATHRYIPHRTEAFLWLTAPEFLVQVLSHPTCDSDLRWPWPEWLGAGFGFPAGSWAGSRWWEHRILASRPVVSDKGPGLWLRRKEFPQRPRSVKQVNCLLGGKSVWYVWTDTRADSGWESHWAAPLWQFGLLLWDISSRFPLADHADLPGSQPVFGISRIFPCVCTHFLAKMDLTEKACGEGTSLDMTPLQGAFSVHMWSKRSPDFEKRNMWSGQGPPSSLNCPAILILEFRSTGNESQIVLPWAEIGWGRGRVGGWGGICLQPQRFLSPLLYPANKTHLPTSKFSFSRSAPECSLPQPKAHSKYLPLLLAHPGLSHLWI